MKICGREIVVPAVRGYSGKRSKRAAFYAVRRGVRRVAHGLKADPHDPFLRNVLAWWVRYRHVRFAWEKA